MSVRSLIKVSSVVAAGVWLIVAAPAMASYPGSNGRLAFSAIQAPAGPGLFDLPTLPSDPVKGPLRLTTPPASNNEFVNNFDFSPSYSADGTKFVFLRYVNGNYELREADRPTAVISDAHPKRGASLSPDGSTIVFDELDYATHERAILAIGYDGSGLRELATEGAEPAWSPDGTKIAFSVLESRIHVTDADGNNDTTLEATSGYNVSPDWSPDGTKIVFEAAPFEGKLKLDLYTMNADGSGGLTRLTKGGMQELDPVWSPDGTKIAYVRQPLDRPFYTNANIYTMDTRGSHRKRLTIGKYRFTQIFSPGWPVAH